MTGSGACTERGGPEFEPELCCRWSSDGVPLPSNPTHPSSKFIAVQTNLPPHRNRSARTYPVLGRGNVLEAQFAQISTNNGTMERLHMYITMYRHAKKKIKPHLVIVYIAYTGMHCCLKHIESEIAIDWCITSMLQHSWAFAFLLTHAHARILICSYICTHAYKYAKQKTWNPGSAP